MQNIKNDNKNNTSNIQLKRLDLQLHVDSYTKNIADLTETIKQDSEDVEANFCRGMVHSNMVIYGELILAYNKDIDALDAENAIDHDYKDMVQLLDGYCDAAIQDLTKAIELGLVGAVAYELRGKMYLQKGNCDKAIADYTEALGLDAKNVEAYEGRAMAHFRKNHLEEAWSDVEACQRRNGDVDPAFLAALYKASEKPDGR
jgi:tetratricopeptide (TPR) repeat protein